MIEKDLWRVVWVGPRYDSDILRQQDWHLISRESRVPRQVQAYWDQISLYSRYGAETSNETSSHFNQWADSKHTHQGFAEREVHQLGLIDVTLLVKGPGWSRTLSYAFSPCLSSQEEELNQIAPGVEGTLDNRIVCDTYLYYNWYPAYRLTIG